MLGIVVTLQYSTVLVGMDLFPGFQGSPSQDLQGDTPGSVQIITEPAGALVFIDVVNTGRNTPFFRQAVQPGNPDVTVILTGYQSQSDQFKINPGKTTDIRIILVPINQSLGSINAVQQVPYSPSLFNGNDQSVDSPLSPYTVSSESGTVTSSDTGSTPGPVPIPESGPPSNPLPASVPVPTPGPALTLETVPSSSPVSASTPLPLPAPESPSPVFPLVMLVGCMGVVLLLSNRK